MMPYGLFGFLGGNFFELRALEIYVILTLSLGTQVVAETAKCLRNLGPQLGFGNCTCIDFSVLARV